NAKTLAFAVQKRPEAFPFDRLQNYVDAAKNLNAKLYELHQALLELEPRATTAGGAQHPVGGSMLSDTTLQELDVEARLRKDRKKMNFAQRNALAKSLSESLAHPAPAAQALFEGLPWMRPEQEANIRMLKSAPKSDPKVKIDGKIYKVKFSYVPEGHDFYTT